MMWGQLWAGAPFPSHYCQPTLNTAFGVCADTCSILSHNSALSAGTAKAAQIKFFKREFDTKPVSKGTMQEGSVHLKRKAQVEVLVRNICKYDPKAGELRRKFKAEIIIKKAKYIFS